MKSNRIYILAISLGFLIGACSGEKTQKDQQAAYTVIKNVTLIDGTGAAPKTSVSLVIQHNKIESIAAADASVPDNATVVDMTGKTVMPTLICTHAHVGLLKGTGTSAENYTEENVIRQLKRYEAYGISSVVSLGQDRELIFELRERSRNGQLPGAQVFTAGFGIDASNGTPPPPGSSGKILRPTNADEARKAVQQLAPYKPDFIKIWVDDGGGGSPKMPPAVYTAVLDEAKKQGIRVAAHVYYLDDARQLVASGVSVIAHSVRDKDVDDAFVTAMREKGVYYIPTLSLDEYKFVFADQPAWMNEPAFRQALEPGVLAMIQSDAYLNQIRNSSNREKDIAAFRTALRNVKKLYDGGVKVTMGSDSGAQPVRVQGFSEHLELEEMVNAGLTPLQAITCATRTGAELLGIADSCGTIEPGKLADFVVLNGNPAKDIKQTRNMHAVWRRGKSVSEK